MKGSRVALVIAAVVAAIFLVGSVVLWFALASWVPTQGKALLIDTVERQLPIEVSIGSMRYQLFRGLLLEHMHVSAHASHEVLADIPTLRARVGWLALALQRRLAFRAHAVLEAPCRTELFVLGRSDLRTRALTLDARTTDIALSSITAPLTRYLPAPLRDGALRLTLHSVSRADAPLTLSGRVTGSQLVWETPPLRAVADLTLNGTATAPLDQAQAWNIDALVSLRRGTVEGLPHVGQLSELDGEGRIVGDQFEIRALTGTTLGSRWTMEGTVAPLARPRVEALVSSRIDLRDIAKALSPSVPEWQPAGSPDVRAVCRGPLQPAPFLDCLVQMDLRGASLAGKKLTSPLTDVSGRLAYDALTKRLAVEHVSGRLLDDTLAANGEVLLAPAAALRLNITGTLPLAAAMPWLPAHSPISALSGRAELTGHLKGLLSALRYEGAVTLNDAGAQVEGLAHPLEQLNGRVVVTAERIDAVQLSLRVNGQPLTLTAAATFGTVPAISASLTLPQGRISLASRVTPQAFIIDDAQLALTQSRMKATGTVGRGTGQESVLSFEGVVELSELTRLPFVPLPALEPWRLQGAILVDAQWLGRFSAWPDATIRGRARAERLSVRDLPVDQLTCDIEQSDRALRVRVPAALVANGKFVAELTLEHRAQTHDYLAQADLVAMQLARLTEVVPTWRSRQVSGIASAHATLSGTWEARPTWRGEGWLRASGQGLGDIPLLDKLFRGLFGVLGDRLGLEDLRRAQITDATVQWTLSRERLSTEQLRLGGLAGAEPVAIYATGSVGLDQTLDFVIEPELSEGVVLQAPTTSTFARTVLKAAGQLERFRRLIGRHRLTGTLSKPDYRFELSPQDVFKQLGPAPADLLQNLFDALRH